MHTMTFAQKRAFTDQEWERVKKAVDIFQLEPRVVVSPCEELLFVYEKFSVVKEPNVLPYTQEITSNDTSNLRFLTSVINCVTPGMYGIDDKMFTSLYHALSIFNYYGLQFITLPGRIAYGQNNEVKYIYAQDDPLDMLKIIREIEVEEHGE